MLIRSVRARPVRSLADFEVTLAPGLVGISGPNGTGKTNLLETLYFALTGRSFRTSDRRELIPFGESLARSEAVVEDERGIVSTFMAAVSRSEGRRHLLDGNPVDLSTAARHRPHLLVFSPDRLSIVKGPPAERRAHLDAFAEAIRPQSGGLRRAYGQVLAQRNAMLSRIVADQAGQRDLIAWDRALAKAAVPLIESRRIAADEIDAVFAANARDIGLENEATISYQPRADGNEDELAAELERRWQSDLSNRRTGWGPHLDELSIELGGRSLRRYGSQGQQRAGLLALLFAERQVLESLHAPPVMLLDDVMSELDPDRRDKLGSRLARSGQSLITAADHAALPQDYLAERIELDSLWSGD